MSFIIFLIEWYKHEIVFLFFHVSGCFEDMFTYFSIGHSYLWGFSCVMFLKGGKIDFLLCQITLVHFTCIPSFNNIWLSLNDYREGKIRKEKHSSSYMQSLRSLTLWEPRIPCSINRTIAFLGWGENIYIYQKSYKTTVFLQEISLIIHSVSNSMPIFSLTNFPGSIFKIRNDRGAWVA